MFLKPNLQRASRAIIWYLELLRSSRLRPGRATSWDSLQLFAVPQTRGTRTASRGRPSDNGSAPPPDRDAASPPGGQDPAELHQLITDHSDAVFRLAFSIVRDRALAEDVAQDTMVKAWLALNTFRGESSVRSWIMRIAYNTAISTLRSRRALVIDPATIPESMELDEAGPDSAAERSEIFAAFEAALDQLDDLSRSVVVLREIEGLSYDHIARLLEVPLPTVKTRLLRARRKLASALREWS